MERYTLKQLAQELGRPESTVRSWRDAYGDYIPSEGEGRAKRYTEEALEVLRWICDRKDQTQESAADTKAALAGLFPLLVDLKPVKSEKSSSNSAAAQAGLEIVGQALQTLADQSERMERLERQLEAQREEIEALKGRRFFDIWKRK